MTGINGSHTEARPRLWVASAQSRDALDEVVAAYRTMLAGGGPDRGLQDLCDAARARHGHGNERLGIVARSVEDLVAQLDSVAAGDASPTVVRGQARAHRGGKLAFVFSGQGSQWLGMGRELFAHEPVFRAVVEQCDKEVRALLSWSVIEELLASPETSRLDEIDVLQPVIYAFQVALAALWRSWGIAPDVVIGHSVGEVAAAHVAGAISLADGARIVCARSRVSTDPCARGAMAVIGLPAGEVEGVIAPWRDRVWISIHESPESTVISGETQAIDRIVAEVLSRDVFGRRVKAPVAGHCSQWDSLRQQLLDLVAGIQPRAASVRMQSTVDLEMDARADHGAAMGAAYWWPNLRDTVLFAQAMGKLIADGVDTFLEISPHPILCHAMLQCAKHAGTPITALASSRRNGDERTLLLSALAALHVQGHEIDWPAVCGGTGSRVALPSSPRQRGEHALIGPHIELQDPGSQHVWESSLDTRMLPMLAEHRVFGTAVLPGAAYLEMALVATRAIFKEPWPVLEHIAFDQALALPADSDLRIQLTASETGDGVTLRFHARRATSTTVGGTWSRLAVAHVVRAGSAAPPALVTPDAIATIRARCREVVASAAHYRQLADRGVAYGPSFQGVHDLVRRDGEALGMIAWPASIAGDRDDFLLHPALLDACLQVGFAVIPHDRGPSETYVPVGVRRLRVATALPVVFDAGPFFCHARLVPGIASSGALSIELLVSRSDGSVVVEIGELRLQPLEAPKQVRPSAHAARSKPLARSVRAELLAIEEANRGPRLEAFLVECLGGVLGRSGAQIRPELGLNQLGLDSLMALEFRNRVHADLGVAPPLARLVVSDVSLRVLAQDLLQQLAAKAHEPTPPVAQARRTDPETELGIDELTDDHVRALLQELSRVG